MYLLVQISILIFSLVFEIAIAGNEEPKPAEIVTAQLVKNTKLQAEIMGVTCSFKILLDTENVDNEFALFPVWSLLARQYETVQLFYQFSREKNLKFYYQKAPTRHISSCWNLVFVVNTIDFMDTLKSVHFEGFDYHIFLSRNFRLLEDVMSSDIVLNSIVLKYGMFLVPTDKTNAVGYLIEPETFTGSFVFSSRVHIQRKVNNLNGRVVKTAFLHVPPYFVKVPGKTDKYDGSQYLLVSEIAKRTNSTLAFYGNMSVLAFGLNLGNGTWTGLIGELKSGRADLSPTMAPTFERWPLMSMTTSGYRESLVVSVKQAIPGRRWHALVDPLTPSVWLSTFLIYFCFATLFIVKIHLFSNESGSLAKIILLLYGALVDQFCAPPKGASSRALVLIWVIFAYLIGTAYKSNLVTFLTFEDPGTIPKTFKQLDENLRYSIMMHSVGGIETEMMQSSPNPVMQGISKRLLYTNNLLSCLKFAANEESACIAWRGYVVNKIAHNSALVPKLKMLHVGTQSSANVLGCLGLTKGSIFYETFNRYVGLSQGGNLGDFWKYSFIRRQGINALEEARKSEEFRRQEEAERRENAAEDSHRKLNAGDLLIVFVVIFGGIFVSLQAFFMEVVNNRVFNLCTKFSCR